LAWSPKSTFADPFCNSLPYCLDQDQLCLEFDDAVCLRFRFLHVQMWYNLQGRHGGTLKPSWLEEGLRWLEIERNSNF
jgi:hypothetical protein